MEYRKKLSVIIPVYDTEKYLRRCLESAIRALPDNSEVLIINDGSPDNSETIALEFAEKYTSLIRYYKKENGGRADARNFALERTQGEYIAFLDSDDYVDERMYTELLRVAGEQNAPLAICDIEMVYGDDRPSHYFSCRSPQFDDAFFQAVDPPLMTSPCNKIVHKSLYNGISFPKGMNNEDVAVMPVLYRRAEKIAFVGEAFYKYFQRPGSYQNSQFGEHRSVIIETARFCIDHLSGDADPEAIEKTKGTLYVHHVLGNVLHVMRELGFSDRYKVLKPYIKKAALLLPDLYTNKYVLEMKASGTRNWQIYKKTMLFLMKHRLYFMTCLAITIANIRQRSV